MPEKDHEVAMEWKKRVLCLAVLLAAGQSVAHEAGTEAGADGQGTVAESPRLRLFGQNGVGVVLYTNTTCTRRSDETIRVSGSMGGAFSSMLGRAKNESLGIPETSTTRSIGQRGMLLSKAYFREYALKVGVPVVVEAGARSPAGWHCDRLATAAFTPQAGKDYEAAFDVDFAGGVCTLRVNAVAADGSLSVMQVVPASKDCAQPVAVPPER